MAIVSGSFVATGQSAGFAPEATYSIDAAAPFNLSMWGTFAGTVQPERSFDGVTWLPLTALGSGITFTAPCTEVFSEPEAGVMYRVNCTVFTSGTINYRISQ